MELILTARSGRHAFKNTVEKLGFDTGEEMDFEQLFEEFLQLADAKKEVYDHDVFYLVTNHRAVDGHSKQLYELVSFQVITNDVYPTAIVELKKGSETLKGSAVGDGPIDALYSVIRSLAGLDVQLEDYKINSLSRGKEAVGRVNIRIQYEGKVYSGRAMDTDIIKASALAFLNGINAVLLEQAIP